MAPPPPIVIDAQAVSGITGSISIACWIIVFAPQIYENFRRQSSEGLSLTFIILWLAGDVFNVLGSVLQGVLPTMIILAVYYTLADIVLLWQCLAYGNGESTDLIHLSPANPMNEDVLETVLSREHHHHHHHEHELLEDGEEQQEDEIIQEQSNQFLNPNVDIEEASSSGSSSSAASKKMTAVQSVLVKTLMVSLVIASGLAGWYISYVKDAQHKQKHPGKIRKPEELIFDPLAQFFGWLCAFLYLGSRIPQILLNYKRKSCEGISFMFFLFACLGNLTYVISILAINTSWHYLWVNSSWLAGSLGTLGLDFTIFVQFFLYNENNESDSESEEESLLSNQAQQSVTYGSA
ncbi:PQ loop repeat-domain-containing protein [Scheffersomyces xylosifermentans]|uniref:PQ loop repeat-domain-containing protein n=1 Tax=Scheffersomyces xylosifermentans TaxID=1304137 RepID=UPI00315D75A0